MAPLPPIVFLILGIIILIFLYAYAATKGKLKENLKACLYILVTIYMGTSMISSYAGFKRGKPKEQPVLTDIDREHIRLRSLKEIESLIGKVKLLDTIPALIEIRDTSVVRGDTLITIRHEIKKEE